MFLKPGLKTQPNNNGNRDSDSINIVNEKNQNRSFEPPSQEEKYCGNYIIGYPKNFVDSNRTLYFYLDNFGPLYPGNLLILTPGSHNLKIWSENENGTVFMENEISDFIKYSMEQIQVDNPIADHKNSLIFISGVFVSLVFLHFVERG
ncbi:putative aminopeptidase [Methanosarcina sp. Kolksee]|jgi:hypothetical protein|uniref:Putative aminopeptidase n=3 Tax=Methanosarcina TaxID=2207 RepID=A0A0E3Q984_9EURY|nr:putative aminopeptidase [Methanosarcina vacuolata Z-761]AKB48969.1 putative aminopeptidase [Methanosarcina sp. Kolksee]